MKSEYYTLHSNGSFERIAGSHPSQQKKEGSGSRKLLTKSRIISASNLVLAAILGISVIVIVALHIYQSTEFYISHIIQVDRSRYLLKTSINTWTLIQISVSPQVSPVSIIPVLVISTLAIGVLMVVTAVVGAVLLTRSRSSAGPCHRHLVTRQCRVCSAAVCCCR